MNNPKVSVIVPVWNAENTIAKCLDSLLSQTLKDIEIIVVNDSSPDNSEQVIRQYTEKDERIVYVKHEKNLMAGGARNTGIMKATTDYIGFMDSDDWADPTMYEILYNKMVSNNWDVVICGFRRVDSKNNTTSVTEFSNRKPIINDSEKNNIFTITNPGSCNKLWKKSLFIDNDIFYPNYLYYQDLATIPRLLYVAKKITFIPEILYNYLEIKQPNSSTTHSIKKKNVLDYFKVFDILKDFLEKQHIYNTYKKKFADMMYGSLTYHINNVSNLMTKPELKDYLLLLFNEFMKNVDVEEYFTNIDVDNLYDILFYKKLAQQNKKLRKNHWLRASKFQKRKKLRFLLVELTKVIGIYRLLKRIGKNIGRT